MNDTVGDVEIGPYDRERAGGVVEIGDARLKIPVHIGGYEGRAVTGPQGGEGKQPDRYRFAQSGYGERPVGGGRDGVECDHIQRPDDDAERRIVTPLDGIRKCEVVFDA